MRYGFIIYTAGDINAIVDLAVEAEAVGWDGVFYWDGIFLERYAQAGDHIYDPWIVLAAIAARTTTIRIGSVLTPLPRRRPWKVARETVSLDRLSRGRLIFPWGWGSLRMADLAGSARSLTARRVPSCSMRAWRSSLASGQRGHSDSPASTFTLTK